MNIPSWHTHYSKHGEWNPCELNEIIQTSDHKYTLLFTPEKANGPGANRYVTSAHDVFGKTVKDIINLNVFPMGDAWIFRSLWLDPVFKGGKRNYRVNAEPLPLP